MCATFLCLKSVQSPGNQLFQEPYHSQKSLQGTETFTSEKIPQSTIKQLNISYSIYAFTGNVTFSSVSQDNRNRG